jgi:phosphoglycerate dehydrogenase-like enzyme
VCVRVPGVKAHASVPEVKFSDFLLIKFRGILGYGAIGRQVARLFSALGMEIYSYTLNPRETAEARRDRTFCLPGVGDPDGVIPARWFHGSSREAINEFLSQDFDIVVISLPLTATTQYLIAKEQFDILETTRQAAGKRKTFLTNIARGAIVRTDDLISALEKGQICGAALDVTDPEPLPKDHALWNTKNVFITPHVSWVTSNYWDRGLDLLEANLTRIHNGEPCLNQMKKQQT